MAVTVWRARVRRAATLLLCLTGAASATRYIFEETVWTRSTWPVLKLRFPVENFAEQPASGREGYELHSSSGTYTRLDLERLREAGRVRRRVRCSECVQKLQAGTLGTGQVLRALDLTADCDPDGTQLPLATT